MDFYEWSAAMSGFLQRLKNCPTTIKFARETFRQVMNGTKYKSQFKTGGGLFMPKEIFDKFVSPTQILGRRGPLPEPWKDEGTFLSPSPILEDVIESSATMRDLEKKLGIPPNDWERPMYFVRIWDPGFGQLRLPTPQSAGANSQFVPGGITSGGMPEGFISLIPFRTTMIMSDGDEATYNNVSVVPVIPGQRVPDASDLGLLPGSLEQVRDAFGGNKN
jgi:hypothetical protein